MTRANDKDNRKANNDHSHTPNDVDIVNGIILLLRRRTRGIVRSRIVELYGKGRLAGRAVDDIPQGNIARQLDTCIIVGIMTLSEAKCCQRGIFAVACCSNDKKDGGLYRAIRFVTRDLGTVARGGGVDGNLPFFLIVV